MTSAALDRLLAVLVVALAATGLVSLRMGAPGDAWLFVVHGVLAGGLAVAVGWKVRTSLPRSVQARRWGRVAFGLVVSLATAAALVAGFAWVAGGRLLTVGDWTVLTIHAWLGLALIPVLMIHLMPRRWRLLVPSEGTHGRTRGRARPDVSRRRVLAAGVISAAAVALFGTAQVADRLAGGIRRFTGSRWLPPDGVPQPTTFYGEPAPIIDPRAWRLRVYGRVAREATLAIDELVALGVVDQRAVLDCTSGWAMDTTWHGVPLRTVLDTVGPADDARSVRIRSVTGWAASLGRAEADRALLATGVAGAPLPGPNGAPCRLVVPDRRGLDWVKWVAEVEVV